MIVQQKIQITDPTEKQTGNTIPFLKRRGSKEKHSPRVPNPRGKVQNKFAHGPSFFQNYTDEGRTMSVPCFPSLLIPRMLPYCGDET